MEAYRRASVPPQKGAGADQLRPDQRSTADAEALLDTSQRKALLNLAALALEQARQSLDRLAARTGADGSVTAQTLDREVDAKEQTGAAADALARADVELKARFAAAAQRGDTVHQREQARYELHVRGDSRTALALAEKNWAVQKETTMTKAKAKAETMITKSTHDRRKRRKRTQAAKNHKNYQQRQAAARQDQNPPAKHHSPHLAPDQSPPKQPHSNNHHPQPGPHQSSSRALLHRRLQ